MPTYNETGLGGALSSGSSGVTSTETRPVSGGVVGGGNVLPSEVESRTTSGGVLLGGVATVTNRVTDILHPNGTTSNSGWVDDSFAYASDEIHLAIDGGVWPDGDDSSEFIKSNGINTVQFKFDNLNSPDPGKKWTEFRIYAFTRKTFEFGGNGKVAATVLVDDIIQTVQSLNVNTYPSFTLQLTDWITLKSFDYTQLQLDRLELKLSWQAPFGSYTNTDISAIFFEFQDAFVDVASGGTQVGGSATESFINSNFEVGEGGAVSGGEAEISGTTSAFGDGGAFVAGSAFFGSSTDETSTGGVVGGGVADEQTGYSASVDGGVLVGGEFFSAVSWVGRGGVDVEGVAGAKASYYYNTVNSDNDLQIAGQSSTIVGLAVVNIGEEPVTIGGSADLRVSYYYNVDNATGDLQIGASAGFELQRVSSKTFVFNIRTEQVLEKDNSYVFKWNTGNIPLSHFRVVSGCLPQDQNVCQPISDPEDACGRRAVVTITAPTPAAVCRQLSERGFRFPIVEFDRFTRPATNSQLQSQLDSGEFDGCNELVPVDFCEIPDCLEFCVDVEGLVLIKPIIGLSFVLEFDYEGSGEVGVGGLAAIEFSPNINVYDEVGSGGIKVDIGSKLVTPAVSYVASGGITIEGTVLGENVTSSAYSYQGDGFLIVGGSSVQKASHYYHDATGGISVAGVEGSEAVYEYIATGGIAISGSYGQKLDSPQVGEPDINQMAIGGELTPFDIKVSAYNYDTFGGVTGGVEVSSDFVDLNVKSSGWTWSAESEVTPVQIGGAAVALIGFSYEADETPVLISGANGQNFTYVGNGTIRVGPEFGQGADFYFSNLALRYSASGGIAIGESGAFVRATDLGLLQLDIGSAFALTEISIVFGETDAEEIPTPFDSIVTECGLGCIDLPLVIEMNHNINRHNKLAEFLNRNRLTLNQVIPLSYNKVAGIWQANIHYTGIGAVGNNEFWNIVFDLQCSSFVSGIELGKSMWRFGVSLLQKNLDTGEDYDTRVLSIFDPESVCQSNVDFLFRLIVDSKAKSTVVLPESTIQDTIVHDNIGLFKTGFWFENPEIIFNVSEVGTDLPARTIDVTQFVNY